MSRALVLSRQNIFYSARPASKQSSSRLSSWVAAALVVANLLSLGSYLVSVNSYTGIGYEIKRQQAKLAVLTEDHQRLSVKVSEISSMASVQSQVLGADFVPAGTPRFLQLQPNQLSQR